MIRVELLAYTEEEVEDDGINYEELGINRPTGNEPHREYFLKESYISPYDIQFITPTSPDNENNGGVTDVTYKDGSRVVITTDMHSFAAQVIMWTTGVLVTEGE